MELPGFGAALMRRIVFCSPLTVGQQAKLDQAQLHYLFDVLRLRTGEKIVGLDNQGNAYIVQLQAKSSGICTVLESAGEIGREPTLAISLILPLLKGDKLDLTVQKAVELGVGEIVLFAAERSVVKPAGSLEKRITRLQKIARDATQQCGRHRVPLLRGLLGLEEVAGEGPGIFAWERERHLSLRACLEHNPPSGRLGLLIGPEGGLTAAEVKILTKAGWTPVTLGPRILRAETAAITLLACTMFTGGEME